MWTAAWFEKIASSNIWDRPTDAGGRALQRQTAWLAPEGCECAYAYGSGDKRVVAAPQPFPSWMFAIMTVIMIQCGLPNPWSWPDCANMNLYEGPQDGVGPHADDEDSFAGLHQAILIISLSLGSTRRFEVRGT